MRRRNRKTKFLHYRYWDKTLYAYDDPGMAQEPVNFRFLCRLRVKATVAELAYTPTRQQCQILKTFDHRLLKKNMDSMMYYKRYGIKGSKFYRYHF